jgi:hypothetical protein
LILVEDDEVAVGMAKFGERIKRIGENLSKRDEDKDFEAEAIKLSYLFRKSIEDSVGSTLPALTIQKPP